jgi:hypothetical protein
MAGWDEDEPLIEGLEALPAGALYRPSAPEGLRRALRDRTARAVRSRVRRRRFLVAALVVLAYGGGVATAYRFFDATADPAGREIAVSRPGEAEPAARDPDPAALEQRAAGAPPEARIPLLQRAGDLYLSGPGNVERAVDCYRRVLEALPPSRRTVVEPGDSWLLLAMKESRR